MNLSMPQQTRTRLPLLAAVAAAYFLAAGTAWATGAVAGPMPVKPFPAAQVFPLLFLMLGPFKILGPFAEMTQGMDERALRQVALWGAFFASLALLAAAFLGEAMLTSYGIPVPILALSGGIILFLVALLTILRQFMPASAHSEQAVAEEASSPIRIALTRLAFPVIVTPYGIAALVVILSVSPDLNGRLTVGAILLAIMLLNLLFMMVERRILPVLIIGLPILGAVLGVVQVALGLQIIHNSLKALGFM